MLNFWDWLFQRFGEAFQFMNSVSFETSLGVKVYLGWIAVAFFTLSIIISVFWKGGRG